VSLTGLNDGIGQQLVKLTVGVFTGRLQTILKFWPQNNEIDNSFASHHVIANCMIDDVVKEKRGQR
jgi:hypothetical protein